MMSASQFKKQSNIFLHRRNSPIIKDIDKLLREYEKPTASPNRRIKCLVYIYLVCKQYLIDKPNGKRHGAIARLLDEVRDVLDSRETREQLVRKAGGEGYHKGTKVDKMDAGNRVMTSLDGAYIYEGVLPQRNFVEKMQLNMDSILDGDKYFGVSGVAYKIEAVDNVDNKTAIDMLRTARFSEVLDYLSSLWATKEDSGMFNYLNSTQRLDYLVDFKHGLLYQHGSDVPLDDAYPIPYAIDLNERVFALPKAKGIGTMWNHSSMLSGAPVICAGEFKVKNGQLIHFDNNSGHYKPGTDNLVDAVLVLQTKGVMLSRFQVEDVSRKKTYASGQALVSAARGGGAIRI